MKDRRVSVANGKRAFTQLLKEVRKTHAPVLIYDERRNKLAGALLSPEEYERYTRMRAYFEAVRLSEMFQHLELNAADLARRSRRDLEGRGQ